MKDEQINRINELYAKSKSTGLTDEEAAEQAELRQMYVAQVRQNMKATLDNTMIQNPDGTTEKLKSRADSGEKH
ncbi:MAG: DUF896 domain-containing protein [Clostridia bacterium]|nr:DUF896 domain-containing protein [Clostridia bacterium]